MNKTSIVNKVNSVVEDELKDIPFDKALPRLREVLWDIAEEIGIEGAEVFEIYMEWLSSQSD